MVRVGKEVSVAGIEHNDLYVVTLFATQKENTVELGVISQPEQQRLMQFLNHLIKWYKLNRDGEIDVLIRKHLDAVEVCVLCVCDCRARWTRRAATCTSSTRRFVDRWRVSCCASRCSPRGSASR